MIRRGGGKASTALIRVRSAYQLLRMKCLSVLSVSPRLTCFRPRGCLGKCRLDLNAIILTITEKKSEKALPFLFSRIGHLSSMLIGWSLTEFHI